MFENVTVNWQSSICIETHDMERERQMTIRNSQPLSVREQKQYSSFTDNRTSCRIFDEML